MPEKHPPLKQSSKTYTLVISIDSLSLNPDMSNSTSISPNSTDLSVPADTDVYVKVKITSTSPLNTKLTAVCVLTTSVGNPVNNSPFTNTTVPSGTAPGQYIVVTIHTPASFTGTLLLAALLQDATEANEVADPVGGYRLMKSS
jgi:hypothetical protein